MLAVQLSGICDIFAKAIAGALQAVNPSVPGVPPRVAPVVSSALAPDSVVKADYPCFLRGATRIRFSDTRSPPSRGTFFENCHDFFDFFSGLLVQNLTCEH